MKPLIQVQAVSQRFNTASGEFLALQTRCQRIDIRFLDLGERVACRLNKRAQHGRAMLVMRDRQVSI